MTSNDDGWDGSFYESTTKSTEFIDTEIGFYAVEDERMKGTSARTWATKENFQSDSWADLPLFADRYLSVISTSEIFSYVEITKKFSKTK